MAEKKPAKDTVAKKDVQPKATKPEKGVRFLSVFSGDGTSFVFRAYPSREETNLKVDSADAELGKFVKKAYSDLRKEGKTQAK